MTEKKAQLIVIYGRRRVGKTYLVEEYFDSDFAFRFTGENNSSKSSQLQNFANELRLQLGEDVDTPKDWKEAFFALRQYLMTIPADKKMVVFFDEMPWMDTPNSHFLAEFEYFWNSWGSKQHNMIFIICGSASSWLII